MAIDDYSDEVTREVESRLDDLFGEFESVQEEEQERVLDQPQSQELPELDALEDMEIEEIEETPEPMPEVVPIPEPEPELPEPALPKSGAVIVGAQDSIEQLKATFYSIDWEITEASMHSFFGQVMDLKKTYSEEPVVYQNLRLLGAVGKYIRRKKAQAHPDSFGLFKSLFNCFQSAVSDTADDHDIKRQFKKEVIKFKKLREEILRQQGKLEKPPQPEVIEDLPPHEEILAAEDATMLSQAIDDAVSVAPEEIVSPEALQGLEASFEDVKAFIRSELSKLKEDILKQVLDEKALK